MGNKFFPKMFMIALRAAVFFFPLVVLMPSPVFSDSPPYTVGVMALAASGKGFQCNNLISTYDTAGEIYLSSLWKSFGTRRDCIKAIFSDSRPVVKQFFLSNEVCREKRNCARYEFLPGLSTNEYILKLEARRRGVIRKIRRIASKILAFCKLNKKQEDTCLIALGLESEFTRKAMIQAYKAVKSVGWKDDQIVHSPENCQSFCGRINNRHFVEWHGLQFNSRPTRKARFIISNDGRDPGQCHRGRTVLSSSVSSAELLRSVQRAKGNSRFYGLWCGAHQGLGVDSGKAPAPRDRKFRFRSGHSVALGKLVDIGTKFETLN